MADMNQISTFSFDHNFSSFDLQTAAGKVINVMRMFNSKEVQIVLKVSKECKIVRCDLLRYQQVLLNVLQNAYQEAKSGTIICVELYTLPFNNSQKSISNSYGGSYAFIHDFDMRLFCRVTHCVEDNIEEEHDESGSIKSSNLLACSDNEFGHLSQ